jgi:DnaJ family protein A protein 2
MPSYKHYETLGLSPKADAQEINKAYKQLAMKCHPDKGGDSQEFIKITEAFETLRDPEKKAQYDDYGDDGQPNPFESMMGGGGFPFGMGGGGGGGFPFDFMFGGMGGGRGNMRKAEPQLSPPITHNIRVSMEDAYQGKEVQVNVDIITACEKCIKVCSGCNGTKHRNITRQIGPGIIQTMMGICDVCKGTGHRTQKSASCQACDTNAMKRSKFSRTVVVPPGVQSGDNITFTSQGNTLAGMTKGNIVVQFDVEKKKDIEVGKVEIMDTNLHYTINLPFLDSLLGVNVTLWHPSKQAVTIQTMSLDNVINPTKKYTLVRKGMKQKNSSSCGDLIIQFNVLYNLDAKKIPDAVKKELRSMLEPYVS